MPRFSKRQGPPRRDPASLPAPRRPFLLSVPDHAVSSSLPSALMPHVLATLLAFKVSALAGAGAQQAGAALARPETLKGEQSGQHLSHERASELRAPCGVTIESEGRARRHERGHGARRVVAPSSSRAAASAPETLRRGGRSREGSRTSVWRRGPSWATVGHSWATVGHSGRSAGPTAPVWRRLRAKQHAARGELRGKDR